MSDNPILRTAELVGLVKNGEAGAAEELFKRYAEPVRAMARVRLDPRLRRFADSCDVMQEVLMSAFRGIDAFEMRDEASFLHWLGKNCANRIKDTARKGKRMRRDLAKEVPIDGGDDDGFGPAAHLAADQPTPSAAFDEQEQRDLVHHVVSKLDDESRELILMRDYSEMSWQQIGEELGIQAEAARKRHFTAKGRLGRALRAAGYVHRDNESFCDA